MCKVYAAAPEVTQGLMGLAKETKGRGWWHARGDVIPEGFDLYIGLEESADRLPWYSSELVPGLFQTPDHARVLIKQSGPARDQAEVERRVRGRITRQALLARVTAAPRVDVAIKWAVLRRPVGGATVMAARLDRLVQSHAQDNVSIRVVPYSAGLHAGIVSGPFVRTRFPTTSDGRETEPPTVHVEGFTGALYLDKTSEIERYDGAFASIWGSALDEAGSTNLLQQAAGELSK